MGKYDGLYFHSDGTVTYWSIYRGKWIRKPILMLSDIEIESFEPNQKQKILLYFGSKKTKKTKWRLI